MNAITTTGPSMALLPQNLTEAMKLADLMSKAKLLPQAVQNPADAFMIVNQALRWGMDPFAVAQEVAVIQGKMMYSGKIVAAAIHTSGVLDGRLSYAYEGTNGDLTVTVTGKLRGEAEPRTVTVHLKDAKTSNQHWAKSPEQMLSYHGARVWARRHAPEVMLGVYAPEEFDEPAEPRPVQSTIIRPEPKPLPPEEVTYRHTPSRTKPAQQPTMDETLGGDGIPDWDAPAAPKPDRLRKVADRIKERLSGIQSDADYRAIMEHVGMQAEWAKIVADRPKLAEELEQHRAAELDRIARAEASAP